MQLCTQNWPGNLSTTQLIISSTSRRRCRRPPSLIAQGPKKNVSNYKYTRPDAIHVQKKGKGYAIANTAHNGPVPVFVYHSARNMNAKPATFRPNNGRLAFVRTRLSRRAHTRKLQNNAEPFVCERYARVRGIGVATRNNEEPPPPPPPPPTPTNPLPSPRPGLLPHCSLFVCTQKCIVDVVHKCFSVGHLGTRQLVTLGGRNPRISYSYSMHMNIWLE